MALKKYKPITAGTRWRIGNAYAEVTTNDPEKSLLETKKEPVAVTLQGRRTMRYIGGGHKKKYRIIDFKRNKKDIQQRLRRSNMIRTVLHSSHWLNILMVKRDISLLHRVYRLVHTIISGDDVAPEIGNALTDEEYASGYQWFTILKCSRDRVVRLQEVQVHLHSLRNKEEKYAVLKMPSGELRKVLINCYATVGVVSNSDHNLQSMGKAGRKVGEVFGPVTVVLR